MAISTDALRTFARDTRYAFTENPLTLAALVIFLVLVACAVLGPSLVPYDPLLTNSEARLVPPSWAQRVWATPPSLMHEEVQVPPELAQRLEASLAREPVAPVRGWRRWLRWGRGKRT